MPSVKTILHEKTNCILFEFFMILVCLRGPRNKKTNNERCTEFSFNIKSHGIMWNELESLFSLNFMHTHIVP